MQTFTGFEYLLIDVANNYCEDHDKLIFDERIQWATDNLDQLEALADGKSWKSKPLYLKAVKAVRKAQAGKPTGHLVGFDAVCSGMQIMSALMGCEAGGRATGLVDTGKRPDAYTDCTDIMTGILGRHIPGERKKVKQAVMTCLYGSKKEPKKEFGEDTPELEAFYQAMFQLCPGACTLLQALLDSWQPYALVHEWTLPDGFQARVKVMQKAEHKIEVDELDHATFNYVYYVNEGEEKGVKNAANVIHSIDAYVQRSLIRRCNYDLELAFWAHNAIADVLLERSLGLVSQHDEWLDDKVEYYREQYERSGIADIVILPHLYAGSAHALSDEHLRGLSRILSGMLSHKPFEIVTVHDDFKAHPNNLNQLRLHYREILAELADSALISDLLSQIHGMPVRINKLSPNLSSQIRQSHYALC